MTKSKIELLRLNQALALCGVLSRRKADELIAQGQVSVNGKVNTQFNTLIDLKRDCISIGGKPVSSFVHEYILVHKPKGVVSTCSDEKNRKSLLDILPPNLKHLKPVGRLDRDSSGLILMTNDGHLAQKLIHPSSYVLKTYRVLLDGMVSASVLSQLKRGVQLADGFAKPKQVRLVYSKDGQSCLEIGLCEGRNRQVRRMCSQLGLQILTLTRVSLGELKLNGLKLGDWRNLSKDELKALKAGM